LLALLLALFSRRLYQIYRREKVEDMAQWRHAAQFPT
jgi:hypothetical protein